MDESWYVMVVDVDYCLLGSLHVNPTVWKEKSTRMLSMCHLRMARTETKPNYGSLSEQTFGLLATKDSTCFLKRDQFKRP